MFWRLGFAQSSPIETLLDSDDYTLQQLLDEDDLVQECKQINNKLLDFLSIPEQVEAMVNYIADEPPEDANDKLKLVYPYKSSEVLSSDVGSIHDCLLQHGELLDKLFAILDKEEGQLNYMRAAFFSKVLTAMMNYRPEDTLSAIKDRGGMGLLLRHISTYSILELLQKVVQEAEDAGGGGAGGPWCDWLVAQDLVAQLLARLDESESALVHENVCGALVWLVSQHGQMQWVTTPTLRDTPLAKRLLDPEIVSLLLDKLTGGKQSALEHGLNVVLEITKVAARELYKDPVAHAAIPKTPDPAADAPECPSDFLANLSTSEGGGDSEVDRLRREAGVASGTTIGTLLHRLDELVALLQKPPAMAAIVNSTGRLDPPLGIVRLRVIELLAMLVQLENAVVEQRLALVQALPAVLDMFFRYEWHNLLHNNVRHMVELIIMSESPSTGVLKQSLLEQGELLSRIIKAHTDNDTHVKNPKAARKGYMGHLRLMSIAVVKAAKWDALVKKHADKAEWKIFIKAHQEITDEVNDGGNDSTSASLPPASPAHTAASPPQDGALDALPDGSGAALEAQAGNASSSPTRDSPPQKELPAPPTSPKQLPPDSKGGPPSKAAAAAPSVDTLARVVASVTLNLRMHEGAPIASAQVSLKVA